MPISFAVCRAVASFLLFLSILTAGLHEPAIGQSIGDLFSSNVGPPEVDYGRLEIDDNERPSTPGEAPAKMGAGENNVVDSQDAAVETAPDNQLRVAFLGNTIVHRAAEFGFLEAELTRRAPDKNIVFRNLGWPGDTVSGAARIEFGPGEEQVGEPRRPDKDSTRYGLVKMLRHLKREQPHILCVAYGSNVAFAGQQGLSEFRTGLSRLLNALQPTGVRVVLLTPPPREEAFPIEASFAEQNRWLRQVARHLNDVAGKRNLEIVDLFSSWPPNASGYTDNGIHLNDHGYGVFADIVADSLLPKETPWHLHLNADGSIVAAEGAPASNVYQTKYGMRWNVTDLHLPASRLANNGRGLEPAINSRRRLTIDGLQPGNYSLDIDGRRTARGTAQQWSQGVAFSQGPDFRQYDELRQAIIEKNRQYFYRYRPQNKAYIHLFRAYERGHHATEIERFSLLVRGAEANIARLRLPVKRIYELVRETDYPDHEVPGENFSANVDDELAALNIPEGFEISLFASDPMIAKPININWDERGRMWVATSEIYPHLQPGQTPTDRILIIEDVNGDGRADKSTVFADDLLVPHSVLPGDGGAYVTQSTDVLFLRDKDGDGKADERRVLLTGFGNADVHHMIHQLRWGPGGDIYFLQSVYINSTIETPWGVQTSNGSCIWRLRPETLQLEKHATGLVNPWGHAFDDWGQSFATDGAGGNGLAYIFPGAAFLTNNYADRELPSLNPGRPKECGLEFLTGRHLPDDWQKTFMSNDFRANRSTHYRTSEDGSGYSSDFLGDMITSSHRGFRPVDIKMGPDGAIYIVDWYNLIIDHGEVDFHHPLRDKQHGRIWRLTAKGAPLVAPPKLAGADVRELLDALQLPEQWTRDQARRRLRERGAVEVLPILRSWVNETPRNEHDLLEALWVYQGLRSPNRDILEKCLTSGDHRARAAAVRVLADWQVQLGDSWELLRRAVRDIHPQVRLEAVNALRRVGTSEAVAMALRAIDQPIDGPLDFALFRTAHELRDVWLPDLQAGQQMFEGNRRRLAFALASVGGETIAQPLAELVRKDQIDRQQLKNALLVLASFGDQPQRELVLARLSQLSDAELRDVLTALVESSADGVPTDTSEVTRLLKTKDHKLHQTVMRLIGRWKIGSAFENLRDYAKDSRLTPAERLAAGEAMVSIDAPQGTTALQAIYESTSSDSVRATTIAAWSRASIQATVPLAVSFFRSSADPDVMAIVADVMLQHREAPALLAAELRDVALRKEVAQLLLDRVRLSGQDHADLAKSLRVAGSLQPLTTLTAGEIAEILKDASSQGDVAKGQIVFRRQDTQCVACHVVSGEGGRVGPDLSSVGTTERLGSLLMSILDPNANIKQGYGTVHVFTEDGRVFSGILLRQTETHVRIRDAKDQEHTIPTSDVDEISPSTTSIMPVGLAENLSRAELVHLVRYLSSLGQTSNKPPAD